MDRVAASIGVLRVRGLLRRVGRGGLRTLSRPILAELGALEKTAHAAGLVFVERELAALGAEVARGLDRSPRYRASSVVAALVRTDLRLRAAAEVLQQPASPRDDEVLGVARRRYEPVPGTLVVQAVSASGFVTDAGFTGVSVVLAVPDTGEELLASIVRPSDWFGDDPRRLWFQPVSEVTPLTVAELAHGAWRLDDVKRSADGRLSLHAGLQALPAPPAPARALARYRVPGFREGVQRLADALDEGEGEPAVRVCVEGVRVGAVVADETRATATVVFTDARGATARLVTALVRCNDLWLDNLSRLRDEPPGALVGRLSAGAEGLRFEPHTAWFDQPVRLQHKRAGPVQEVHLALEPLTGPVSRGGSLVPEVVRAPADAAQRALGEGYGLLVELFSTGTTRPEALGDDLVAAAERAAEVGLPGVAGALREVAAALAAGDDVTEPLFAAAARCRLVDRGLALARLEDEAGGEAPVVVAQRRGADRRLWPLGVVREGTRASIPALDPADGSRWTVRDEWRPLPGGRVASALFHGEVDPAELLRRVWVLTDHPTTRSREGRELGPAWHTAPTLAEEVRGDTVPLVDQPAPGPFRMGVEARRGPDGWRVFAGASPLGVELSMAVETELEKRGSPTRFEGRFAGVSGAVRLLALDNHHPDAEPGLTRWPWASLVARARGTPHEALVAALGLGASPEVEDAVPEGATPAEVRRRVLEAAAQVRKNLRRGEGLPPGRVLWAWGRALGSEPPTAALGLPEDVVRRAIVAPLARWLSGASEDPEDALWLLGAAGELELHFAGAPALPAT